MTSSQALSLLLVMLAVAVLPGVSRILRLPSAVTEILFGVVLGKSLLGFNPGGDWMPFLAQLGFLLLMFSAGAELDFTLLGRQGRSQISFQLTLFAATLGLAGLAAWLLDRGVFMTLVLTTTSLGLVMPVLRESGQQKTGLGQAILMAATLADFLTLLGITVFVLVHRSGLSWALLRPLPLFAGFAVLLWAFRRWAWWNPDKAEKLLRSGDPQEQGVRLTLALLFLFVGASELVHLEPVLGAFLGGCILSFVYREKRSLESKLSGLGFGFLVPLFFIHVGMGFDVRSVLGWEQLEFALLLLVLAVGVKVLPGLLYPLWGRPLGDGLLAGVLLSSRLSLIVAAAAIGVEQGFLTPQIKDAVVFLALLTCTLGPVGFKVLAKRRRPGRA